MPKLPKDVPEIAKAEPRRVVIGNALYVNAVARVIGKAKGIGTSDVYRFGRAAQEYFEAHPEGKKEFVKWYEALPEK